MSPSPRHLIAKSRNLHYAWTVASVTGLVLLAAAGVRTAPQVLIKPLEAEFGWLRADISLAVAVSILWFGLGAPLSGTLVGRFGLRAIMTVGLLVIAARLALMSWMDSLWQLHLFWGLIAGVGTGMLANVLGAIVASRWFVRLLAAGRQLLHLWVHYQRPHRHTLVAAFHRTRLCERSRGQRYRRDGYVQYRRHTGLGLVE
jgi:MFS family permease